MSLRFQGRSGKDEQERRLLRLRSLQYLERYIYLILFNAYLHLEKKDSWQRPFSLWMREVGLLFGPEFGVIGGCLRSQPLFCSCHHHARATGAGPSPLSPLIAARSTSSEHSQVSKGSGCNTAS